MDAWIPVIKEFIWPVFWVVALLFGRKPVGRLLKAVEERIAAGAEFEAGATGIKVGAAPKLAEVTTLTARTEAVPVDFADTTNRTARTEALAETENDAVPSSSDIYLVHTARLDRRLDKGELQYYRVRIYLDGDAPSLLDEVSEVTYYLHETFKEPVRIARDRQTSFEVSTIVWGEFNVAAAVRFKDGHEVKLERYLNL